MHIPKRAPCDPLAQCPQPPSSNPGSKTGEKKILSWETEIPPHIISLGTTWPPQKDIEKPRLKVYYSSLQRNRTRQWGRGKAWTTCDHSSRSPEINCQEDLWIWVKSIPLSSGEDPSPSAIFGGGVGPFSLISVSMFEGSGMWQYGLIGTYLWWNESVVEFFESVTNILD